MRAAKGASFGEIKTYNDDPSRYMALAQGRVDAVVNSIASLAIVLEDQPGAFALVRGPYWISGCNSADG